MGAQMFGVGGDRPQGFGGHLKQQLIDHRLIVIGNGSDRRRQGEHDVVVLDRQEVGLAGLEPTPRRIALAFRAMPVTAGVIGNFVMPAGTAMQHMPAQLGAAAAFDGRHHLELA